MAKKKDLLEQFRRQKGLALLLSDDHILFDIEPKKPSGRPVKHKLKADGKLNIRIASADLEVLDKLVLQAAEKYDIERTRTALILFLLDKEYKILNPK